MRRLCHVTEQHVKTAEVLPFKPHSLLRITGELISEIECHPVIATARVGEVRTSDCVENALPVYYKGQPYYLLANNMVALYNTLVVHFQHNQKF